MTGNPYERKYVTTRENRAVKVQTTAVNNTPSVEYKGDVAEDPADYKDWATGEGKMTFVN